MKIIIDIPEVVMETRRYADYFGCLSPKLIDVLESGTPLPKGHGRLIDADETLKAMDTWDKFGYTATGQLEPIRDCNTQNGYISYVHYDDMVQCVANMSAIIEADKGETEWERL